MIITKQFKFDYAHRLPNAYDTKCRNFHGHSGIIEITIEGNIKKDTGVVLDFKEMQPIKELVNLFDHSMIIGIEEPEEVKTFFMNNTNRLIILNAPPTCENLNLLFTKLIKKWIFLLNEKIVNEKIEQINNNKSSDQSVDLFFLHSVKVWEVTTAGSINYNDDILFFLNKIKKDEKEIYNLLEDEKIDIVFMSENLIKEFKNSSKDSKFLFENIDSERYLNFLRKLSSNYYEDEIYDEDSDDKKDEDYKSKFLNDYYEEENNDENEFYECEENENCNEDNENCKCKKNEYTDKKIIKAKKKIIIPKNEIN